MISDKFGAIDIFVLIAYLGLIFGVAVMFSKRQVSTDDYFKGGNRIPSWAAGMSIFATTLSSITFMSIPAKAYTSDWTFITGQFIGIITLLLALAFYIPIFKRANVISIYEYLETRFNLQTRLFASLSFMMFHIGRIGIIIYLTSLALSTAIDINPLILVGLIGIVCIVYTLFGGIEGVVWTDVIQGFMLSGAAIFIFGYICFSVDGGMTEIFTTAYNENKIYPLEQMKWSFTEATIPVLSIGFFFSCLQQYTTSQDVIQRYVLNDSQEETKKAIMTTVKLTLVVPAAFFAIGSGLYVFYKQNPQLISEGFNSASVLTYFVIEEMPVGITGLIIAAIFAASQSSISSSLNSISSCYTSDIYALFGKTKTQKQQMKMAKAVILVSGLFSVMASVYLVVTKESEIWDTFNSLLGLLGGTLTGIFFVAAFIPFVKGRSILVGIVASIVAVMVAKFGTDLNFFFYGVIGALTVVIVSVPFSMIENLKGTK
ncbi:sodium:solute symporter [Photobacterium damselae subsp. piscicida]|nr:sodium:solute symporter [Photobacterium damselae subsp. piscicida]